MRFIKRIAAPVMALVMVICAMSPSAFAMATTEDADNADTALSIETKARILRQGETEWIDASDSNRVKPGDTVRYGVYAGTSYLTNSSYIKLYYDTAYLTPSASYTGNYTTLSGDDVGAPLDHVVFRLNAPSAGAIKVNLNVESSNAVYFNAATRLFEIEFTVNAGASGVCAKGLWALESDLGDDTNFPFINPGEYREDALDMWEWDLDSFETSETPITTINSVTINPNGGTFEGGSNTQIIYEDTVGTLKPLPAVTRQGSVFNGWSSSNPDVAPPANDATTVEIPYDEVEFTAKWARGVNITFVDADGTTPLTDVDASNTAFAARNNVMAGSAFADPGVPVKQGYRFAYWSSESQGAGIDENGALPSVYPGEDNAVETFVYKANWDKYISVGYDLDGGSVSPAGATLSISGSSDNTVYSGNTWDESKLARYSVDAATFENDYITKTGFVLVGWQVITGGVPGAIITDIPAVYPSDDTVYKAIWEEYELLIRYVVDDVTVSSERVPYGTAYTVIGYTDSDTGESVTQWEYTSEGSTLTAAPGASVNVTSAITFTAKSFDTTAPVTVRFLDSDGTVIDSDTYNFGDALVIPADPEKEGYTFTGWEPAPATAPAVDTDYTATYAANENTIVYVIDDTIDPPEVERISVTYGEELDVIEDPVKEGYTFVTWEYKDGSGTPYTGTTMPDFPLTAEPVFEPNPITVTFYKTQEDKDNDNPLSVVNKLYDETLLESDIPVITDEGFLGWSPQVVSGQVLKGDLEVVGTWETEEEFSTIYFIVSEDTTLNDTMDLGPDELILENLIEEPEVEGYNFTEWKFYKDINKNEEYEVDDETLMPAFDLYAYAVMDPEPITVTFYKTQADKADNNPLSVVNKFYDDTLLESDIPVITDEGFLGWSPAVVSGQVLKENLEFVGTWEEEEEFSTIYFIVNEDTTLNDTMELGPDEIILENLIEDPEVEGYDFIEWKFYKDADKQEEFEVDDETLMPAFDLYAYAVMESQSTPSGDVVKLVPKTSTSTAMIERGGVVETYNTGITEKPNGVTSIVTAFDDTYGDYARYAENDKAYDSWYVYGLARGLTVAKLADYITVTGDGTYTVEGAYMNRVVGTGTIIKVFDKDGNFVEQFRVVIYGDIDGNGAINGTDTSHALNEVASRTWSGRTTRVNYIFRAADLDQNGAYNGTDSAIHGSSVSGEKAIDQKTGRSK